MPTTDNIKDACKLHPKNQLCFLSILKQSDHVHCFGVLGVLVKSVCFSSKTAGVRKENACRQELPLECTAEAALFEPREEKT